MANRVYVPFTLFNIRIVNMRHLWEPSHEYLGKKTEKPNYFITCIAARTRQNWYEEPTFAPAWAAYSSLLQQSGMTPEMVTEWPIRDGNIPTEPGKSPADWAKDQWVLGGTTSQPIKVELVQGGNVVPLVNKVGVKPGDTVALGLSAAVKQNNPRALKHFCNTVLFMAPGEEIAVGQSVSGAELMQQAQAQGLNVAGFQSAPGFGGQPSGGFPGGAGGFTGPQGGAPGFPSHGPGGAPMGMPQNGGPVGMPGNGAPFPSNTGPAAQSSAFPSSGAPSNAHTFTGPQGGSGAFPAFNVQNGPGAGGPAFPQ